MPFADTLKLDSVINGLAGPADSCFKTLEVAQALEVGCLKRKDAKNAKDCAKV